MYEVGAFEAKNKLGTLLDWVEAGEEVLITRRGKVSRGWFPPSPVSTAPRRAELPTACSKPGAASRSAA